MSVINALEAAIRGAGVAITSLSMGRQSDRTTWRVTPVELQEAAQPIIDAFVEPTAEQLLDDAAQREVDVKALKAIVIELHALVPAYAGKPTLAQLRDKILARYKVLNGS